MKMFLTTTSKSLFAILLAGTVVLLVSPPARRALAQDEEQSEQADERPGSQTAVPQPIVGTHDLMELFNEPLYHRLRDKLKEDAGSDLPWSEIEHDAQRLAEVANLVVIRKEAGEHQQWKALAGQMQRASLELAKVTKRKNAGATREAYRTLIRRCNDCHQSTEPDHAPILQPFGS